MSDPPNNSVFMHIRNGANDPHRALMALNMAALVADYKHVLLYFDIKIVEVVLKYAIDLKISYFPLFLNQLKTLIEKGAYLYVCPCCLKVAGKTETDGMDGVKIAEKETFSILRKIEM